MARPAANTTRPRQRRDLTPMPAIAYSPGLLADSQRVVLHGLYLLELRSQPAATPAELADIINADYNDAGGHGIAISTPDTRKALPALVEYGLAGEHRGRYQITNGGAEFYERLGGFR